MDEIIGEYYNHASLPDFIDSIESLLINKNRYRVLERLIEISLEHKNEYRELSSKCVQYFITKKYLTEINVAEAFCVSRLLNLVNQNFLRIALFTGCFSLVAR